MHQRPGHPPSSQAPCCSGEVKVVAFAGDGEFTCWRCRIDTSARTSPYIGTHEQMPGRSSHSGRFLPRWAKPAPSRSSTAAAAAILPAVKRPLPYIRARPILPCACPFLKEKAETFSGYVINNTPNAIFVLDEDLCVQQINKAGCALFNLQSAYRYSGFRPIVRHAEPGRLPGRDDHRHAHQREKALSGRIQKICG